MPTRCLVTWRGHDPVRVDAASVVLDTDSLDAHGTSLTPGYALEYRLSTGPGWVTRELHVSTRGERWRRSVVLRRHPDGQWSAVWDGDGGDPLPRELPDLQDALDCDLGLCPLTNTMPILRHDFIGAAHRGGNDSHDFLMAWVSVPDLAVHQSRQRYSASDAVDLGGALVVYASERFRTTLEVDADGLVANYPGLGRLLMRVDEIGPPAGRGEG
jgi:hypothetical protein